MHTTVAKKRFQDTVTTDPLGESESHQILESFMREAGVSTGSREQDWFQCRLCSPR